MSHENEVAAQDCHLGHDVKMHYPDSPTAKSLIANTEEYLQAQRRFPKEPAQMCKAVLSQIQ